MNKEFKTILLATFTICFLAESAWTDECFKLSTSMKFGNKKTGEIEVKEICKSNLDHLMSLPIYGTNDRGEGIVIREKKYKNCKDGFNSDSGIGYETAMESFYIQKCELIKKINLGQVKQPKTTYLKEFDFLKLDQIPANIIISYGFFMDQQHEDFKKSKIYKYSMLDLVKKKLAEKNNTNRTNLEFKFEDVIYSLTEIMRADFNDDEIEDILVNISTRVENGTHRTYSYFIVTKTSDSTQIKQITEEADNSCLDEIDPKKFYKCLNLKK